MSPCLSSSNALDCSSLKFCRSAGQPFLSSAFRGAAVLAKLGTNRR